VWVAGLVGALAPLYLYPDLIGRAWPAYVGIVAVAAGCVVAWWEPRPHWRAVGATLAVLAALWLWFLGVVLVGIETCGFESGCPSPDRGVGVLKGAAVHLGTLTLLVATWRSARSSGGRWTSGVLVALITILAVIWMVGLVVR
jgi:hypothetical protein